MRKQFTLASLKEFLQCSDSEFLSKLDFTQDLYEQVKDRPATVDTVFCALIKLSLLHDIKIVDDLLQSPAVIKLMWLYLGYKINIDSSTKLVKIEFPYTFNRELTIPDSNGISKPHLVSTDHVTIKGISNFYSFSNQVMAKILESVKVNAYDAIATLINNSINQKYFN